MYVGLAFVMGVSTLSSALPFIMSQTANAVGAVKVTPLNTNGWVRSTPYPGYTDAQVRFVNDAMAPVGSGAIRFDADASTDYTTWTYDVQSTNANASSIDLHYSTKRLAGPSHAAASLALMIDRDGDFATEDGFYAIYEPVYNKTGSENFSAWNTWNVTQSSKFWYAAGYAPKPTEAVNYTPLSTLLAIYPNAKIQTVDLNFGTGNSGWSVLTDNIKLIDGTIFDFDPATIVACSTTSNVHSASLAGWDLSSTSTDGSASNQVTASGLRVKTEAAGHRKAAGYYPVNFKLSNLGTDTISDVLTMTVNSGSQPGAQLVVDFDDNGTPDGILVGENVYGNNWWLSNSAAQFAKDGAPQTGGGNGSNWFGRASEWLNAFPTATVKAIGYSMGSGMTGDVTITKITAGCTTYTFGPIAPLVTITTPAEGSVVSTKANGNNLKVAGNFTDDQAVNYLQIELVKDGNLVTVYYVHYNNAGLSPDGSFSVNIPVAANIAEGAYSLFYTGTDFDGAVTARMERKFAIDNTKPSKPTITSPTERQWFRSVPITNKWSASTDNVGVAKYQVAYAYADGHSFAGSTCVGEMIGGVNVYCRDEIGLSRNHQPALSEQGKVTIWVRAFDQAGNTSDWSKSVYYYYDGVAPMTTISVSAVEDGKFTVSGAASDNSELNRVYVQLVHRETGVRYGGTTVHLIGTGSSSPWSVEYDVAGLPEGNYAAHVSVVDMAGNSGSAGWTDNFFVDKTAPTVSINEIDSTTDTTPEITGTVTGSDVNRVEVSFDNGATWQLAVLNGNNWSYQVSTPLTLGNITVRAKATDNAGNTTSPVASETFTVSEPEQVANGGGTPTAQTATTQGGGLPITPFLQDNNTDVLGEQDTNTEQQVALENDDEADSSAVAGATDEGDKAGDWTSPFGLAWYWWLLILAAVIGGLWWFFAARRAAKEE